MPFLVVPLVIIVSLFLWLCHRKPLLVVIVSLSPSQDPFRLWLADYWEHWRAKPLQDNNFEQEWLLPRVEIRRRV